MNMYYKCVVKKLKLNKRVKNKRAEPCFKDCLEYSITEGNLSDWYMLKN